MPSSDVTSAIRSPRPKSRKISSSRALICVKGLALTAAPAKVVASANLGETKRSRAATFRIALARIRGSSLFEHTPECPSRPAHHERRIVAHAEDDDPGRRIILADTPRQLESGEVGKPYVHDRDVGMLLQVRPVARLRVGSLQDLDGGVRRTRPGSRSR